MQARAVPVQTADLVIVNNHADAIFRVEVIMPESDETVAAIDEERVQGLSTRNFKGALVARPGQEALLEFGAMHMGMWHFLGKIPLTIQPGKTFYILYEFDTARGRLGAQTMWR
ncbi:hypothetical protein [Archangium primigenium]|uniref:hypothetical protein n=1 Tax=[Archangium] primigenium TaxID=2792470 RepID=UPI00195B18B9|nr:hypothetical protein [Archangium primigenium]MBM7117643.1 hypothetical protein [Archangium primigenium]